MADPTWVDGVTPLNSVNLTKLQTRDERAVANGYASLDSGGKVPATQLPGGTSAGTSGVLSGRPAASSVGGTFYYATDQDVLYFSTGAAWLRMGNPAGATTVVYSNVVPAGWVAYDGTALPSSSGVYADLASHLGGTATPDTRGRSIVAKGTHADVSTLGNNDGVALANRSPKHNSTSSLTLPNHGHSHSLAIPNHGHNISDPGHGHALNADSVVKPGSTTTPVGSGGGLGADYASPSVVANGTGISVTNPTSLPAVTGSVDNPTTNPAVGGSVGPGGTRPVDAPAYIVFSVVIAKL